MRLRRGYKRKRFSSVYRKLKAKMFAKRVRNVVYNQCAEVKHAWYQQVANPVSNLGFQVLLNKVGINVGDYQRIGNEVRLKYLRMRGIIMPSTENVVPDVYNQVRMLILLDKQTNSAQPTIAEIFAYSTDPDSFRNPDYTKRFVTLYDKLHVVYNKAGQAYKGSRFNIYRNLKNYKVKYDGDGIGIEDIVNGSLVAVFISDSGAPDHPFVKFNYGIGYSDV